MTIFWRPFRSLASRISSANSDKPYDEERQRLEWDSHSTREPRWKHVQVSRSRKATVFLLLIDLMIAALLLQAFEPLITLLRRNDEFFGPRITLSDSDSSNSWHQTTRSNQIPRILHQTTATETIPEKWVQPQQSCKEAYSDFEYKVNIYALDRVTYLRTKTRR